jgi:hypothetical protein
MTKLTAYGEVKNGGLTITNEKRLSEDLKKFPDCDVEMIIKRKGQRSNPQNRYYWGIVITEIKLRLRELGNDFDSETVHEFLKQKFNGEKIIIPGTGEIIEVGQTTTELNKEEFSIYLEQVIRWANQTLEIIIPEAGEQTQMFNAIIASGDGGSIVINAA